MKAENLIGKNTADVISFICNNNPNIRNATIGRYEALYGSGGQSFLLDILEVTRSQLLLPNWTDLVIAQNNRSSNFTITACSRVALVDSTVWHIPMLDADTGHKEPRRIKKEVQEMKKELNDLEMPPGFILDSGSGLHFIGSHLIPNEDFPSLIEKMGQKIYLVDLYWLGSCEEEGLFTLRANKPEIKLKTPEVVSLFRPRYKV